MMVVGSGKAPDPRRQFETPDALLASHVLSDVQKQALLTEWDSELDGRLEAEAEGMSAADPISAQREARLSEESRRVKMAMTELAKRTGEQ